jgi:hypothetical protein
MATGQGLGIPAPQTANLQNRSAVVDPVVNNVTAQTHLGYLALQQHAKRRSTCAYGGVFSPDEPAAADEINFRRAELLRQIMVENGDGEKQAMITEAGWNDHPRWTRAVRPGQRIEYTIRAYEIAQEEWPWLDAIAMWVFRFPWDQKSYQDYFTFVDTDFEPKPIYEEVQRYARGETQ